MFEIYAIFAALGRREYSKKLIPLQLHSRNYNCLLNRYLFNIKIQILLSCAHMFLTQEVRRSCQYIKRTHRNDFTCHSHNSPYQLGTF